MEGTLLYFINSLNNSSVGKANCDNACMYFPTDNHYYMSRSFFLL